ncbi:MULTISPECIES: LysM peptidoglycan-binding domain-containing protein [Pontibacillus]|uniref:LysM peptidoglycan-binding domain-containing protein n=1 Tax=Pontibacillus chungwhensis TaxID=265426 RepID=A0ABY8URX6_9BACI|nr:MULTISPECIES: LysM peptidoglycan-binding domain-containing protein [Pontibacillus]MCD5323027.1 LysM peptidoglycan-binding domain-containing protein [Pontibacillus sp. HN14]WIF96420.1 LysM peptidoglycan-binding domain-containing protein [Pontibacillus chungwhensis]
MEDSFRHNDQAKALRNRMDIERTGFDKGQLEETSLSDTLPSRSEVHKGKAKRTKWRMRYPLIRLLVVLFIIMLLLLPLYYLRGDTSEDHQLSISTTARAVHNVELKGRSSFDNQVVYEVKSGDTLESIAEKFFGDKSKVSLILHANKMETDDIAPGLKITIPK